MPYAEAREIPWPLGRTARSRGAVLAIALAVAAASAADPLCPPLAYPAGERPGSVAVADLDADGVPDLIATDSPNDQMSVLRGNGDGSFQPPVAFAAGYTPWGALASDLDGDAHLDVVTANVSGDDPNPGLVIDQVSVLRGNGDGSLQAPVSHAVGAIPLSLAAADLDGDATRDLVTANFYGSDLSVLLGRGDGSFAAETRVPLARNPVSVAVADVDADGVPDLAAASVGPAVSILLGNGDGTFQPETLVPDTHDATAVILADLDGDTLPDLVTASNVYDGFEPTTVNVMLGNGDGSFRFPPARFVVGDFTVALAVGDLDGDGRPDLLAANGYTRDLSVLLGRGDGSFQAATHIPLGGFPNSVAVADLDGDGTRDVVSANGLEVFVLLNRCGPSRPRIDIRPGDALNPISPTRPGIVAVALFGSDRFEVADVDPATLAFGPQGATAAHEEGPHLEGRAGQPLDLDEDGFPDLLAHFRTRETGIAAGQAEACLRGTTLDGTPFEGCDAILVLRSHCGIGFELALLLPGLRWLRRRTRS